MARIKDGRLLVGMNQRPRDQTAGWFLRERDFPRRSIPPTLLFFRARPSGLLILPAEGACGHLLVLDRPIRADLIIACDQSTHLLFVGLEACFAQTGFRTKRNSILASAADTESGGSRTIRPESAKVEIVTWTRRGGRGQGVLRGFPAVVGAPETPFGLRPGRIPSSLTILLACS